MRIVIASSGRFHVLNLAIELDRLGHDVLFYSMLPDKTTLRFGLPKGLNRSQLSSVLPLILWQKSLPNFAKIKREYSLALALDKSISEALEPCDHFICMSGVFVKAISSAKEKFKAKVWLERGSRHIDSQRQILPPALFRHPQAIKMRERELRGYEMADRITIPSSQVKESFQEYPSLLQKLFVNPYGTDVNKFSPISDSGRRLPNKLRLAFVGTWSKRKGADILEAAIKKEPSVEVHHAGSVGDQPFPWSHGRFISHGFLPQSKLPGFYADMDALVLPSREEGLSVVQVQALAMGLPVLCSNRTGGRDLGHSETLKSRIIEFEHSSIEALLAGLRKLKSKSFELCSEQLSDEDLDLLSWRAYALRYERELSQ